MSYANTRARLISALVLLLFLGTAGAALALTATDATSAASEPRSTSPSLSVLQPATPNALAAISDEANNRLRFVMSHLDLRAPESVAAVGVAGSGRNETTVVAAGGVICAFLVHGIGGCDDRERVEAGQSIGAEPIGCDAYRVLGVVPDGVTKILVDSGSDGTIDTTVPVESNVYIAVLKPAYTTAVGVGPSGQTQFTVEVPLDYYASTNGACR